MKTKHVLFLWAALAAWGSGVSPLRAATNQTTLAAWGSGVSPLRAATNQAARLAGPGNVAWRVPCYSLTARAMDVREALDGFGVAEGVPVLLSEHVRGTFSGAFKDVPAGEFLDRLTTMHNLTWYYDGASIFISGAGETTTMLIDLRYMKAEEVRALLRELGVEDARFPLKTASDGELIMVSGPPRYVTLVAEMIGKADKLREQRTFNEVEVRLFPLVYTWADSVSFSASGPESTVQIKGVAELLQEIMSAKGGANTREGTNAVDNADARLAEAGAAGFTPLIRAENRLNAVLVRDVSTRMPTYEKLIKELDKPQKLVEIGITTVEMTKEDALDWQLSLQVTGAKGDFSGAAGQNVANLVGQSALAGKGLAGAFTYLGKDVNVNGSLSALRVKGKARNVSRTSLLTLNNLAAEMSDRQSYHARVVGTEVASLEEVSAGTLLQIKPRIVEPPAGDTNAAAQVWLTMRLEDGGFETVTVDSMPMTRTSAVETQASLPDGDSLLLAGYLRDVQESAGWGIPYLRDIPILGWLFGGASHNAETVQRLFILTPHVVDLPYYKATTQDVVTVQAMRQRDVRQVEDVEEAAHKADNARRLRREKFDERREIRDDADREELRREIRERQLRREIRRDATDDGHAAWRDDFLYRRKEYRDSRGELPRGELK